MKRTNSFVLGIILCLLLDATAVLGGDILILDQDTIDNGLKAINDISVRAPFCGGGNASVCVNDDIANLGLRELLFKRGKDITPYSGITLPTGKAGDEGLFRFTNPDPQTSSQHDLTFTIHDFVFSQGHASNENNLDKIRGVVPLNKTDILNLKGQSVCAVVYDSDISYDKSAGYASLKGSTRGLTAFLITDVVSNSKSLPMIRVDLLPSSDVLSFCESILTANVDNDGDQLSENQGDCNDSNSSIYPGAPEVCNAIDDNCDGVVDEGNSCNQPPLITSTPTLDAVVGQAYSYDVEATDPNNDTLTYSLITSGAGMTIDPASGLIQWTPSQAGVQSVEVKAADPGNLFATQSFSINVTKINQAPTAFDDRYAVRQRKTLTIPAPGVLENDIDPDEDALTANLQTGASKGTLDFLSDGSFTYAPFEPGPGSTEPVLKFSYHDGTSNHTRTQPLVIDLDKDGVAEIVFNSGSFSGCRLTAVHGNDGSVYFSINAFQLDLPSPIVLCDPFSELAAGDIDGDGFPEIIAVDGYDGGHIDTFRRQLIAFNHDGSYKWTSQDVLEDPLIDSTSGFANPVIADLNKDGAPEIVVGYCGKGPLTTVTCEDHVTVFNNQGQILWTARGGGSNGNGFQAPVISDINLDGYMEILFSDDVYDRNGNRLWTAGTCLSCLSVEGIAVANLDDDPFAEIVYQTGFGDLYVYEHTGVKKWGQLIIPASGSNEGKPTVGDVDGDGVADIVVTGWQSIWIVSRDGAAMRSIPVPQALGGFGGNPTIFDLNGDGKPEILHVGERGPFDVLGKSGALYIFDGETGALLHSIQASRNGGAHDQGPIVADVDGDGSAEIVTGGWNEPELIHVFEGKNATWMRSRPIWNQLSYHVTNVNSDGTIPASEEINWLTPGLNNFRVNVPLPEERNGQDSDVFNYKANDGELDSNAATVTIDILPPNTAPSILSLPLKTASLDLEYLYAVHAVDPDAGEVLTFTLPQGPVGMTIDSATGVIRWTPEASQSGSQLVAAKVTDSQGEFAFQGFTIHVVGTVSVPDVVGQSQAAAESAIVNAGLIVGTITNLPSNAVPAGDVISQEPDGGTSVSLGSPVNLVVSSGQQAVTVPNVVNQTQAVAITNLTSAGLTTGTISTSTSVTVPAGSVISQNPSAGTSVPLGSAVNLVISTGTISLNDLASIIVNPNSPIILSGDTIPFHATGVFNDGTSLDLSALAVWTSGSPSVATISATGVATGVTDGTSNIQATLGSITGNATLNVSAKVPGDSTPPTASITAPGNNTNVTGPVNIIGTATDTNFLKYELEFALAGETNFTLLQTGTTPVINGTLGTFDPTILLNQLYTIRLTVYDQGGNIAAANLVCQSEGNWKVGLFTLTFTDVSVPLSGLPIVVNRVYDSRDKSVGDFGVGWRLDVQTMRIRTNRILGTGWERQQAGASINLVATDDHKVSVTLPDGTVEEFDMVVSPTSGFGSLDFTNVTGFAPRPGTLGTLQVLGNTGLAIVNAGAEEQIVDDSTFNTYDPQLFRYTTVGGMQIEIHRTQGVQKITDPNGNILSIGPNGILHSSGEGISFIRDAQNRITQITDPKGNTQSYAYNANGDLIIHTDSLDNETTFFYDWKHNLIKINDPLGRIVARNEYDASGRLTAHIDTNGNRIEYDHNLAGNQEIIRDRLGRVTVSNYDNRGNILSQTDPLGHTTTFTYDARDNLLTQTDPLGNTRSFTYDSNNNQLTETDALGNTRTYTYDSQGRNLSVTDPLGHTTSSTYDANGNLVLSTDAAGNVTTSTYDSAGNILNITDPAGNTSQNQYNSSGRRTQLTDAIGRVTAMGYDANGNLLTQTSGTAAPWTLGYDTANRPLSMDFGGMSRQLIYDAAGQLAGVTAPTGQQFQITYDPLGLPTQILRSDNSVLLSYTYDAEGNKLTETDPSGNITHFEYNAANRLVKTTFPDGSNEQKVYDAAGNLIQVTDVLGRITHFEYDAADRLIQITDPSGGITLKEYDSAGNLKKETDPLGHATQFTYDAANRLVLVTLTDGKTEQRTYDGNGNLLQVVDPAGHTTTYTYDGIGRKTKVTDALGNVTNYEYDDAAKKSAIVDANGNRTTFDYDAHGRLVKVTYPGGDHESATYDVTGRVLSYTNGNGQTLQYAYNSRGRVQTLTLPDASTENYAYTADGLLSTVTSSVGVTQLEYEPVARRLSKMIEPDGRYVRYQYDAAGNRTLMAHAMSAAGPEEVTQYAYDSLNRLIQVTDPNGGTTTYTYDLAGNMISITQPDGTKTTVTHDLVNRVTSETYRNSANAILAGYAYILDAGGNRTNIQNTDGSRVEYDYDSTYKVIAERHFSTSGILENLISYNYDAVGNLLSKTGTTGNANYSYNSNSQLITGDGFTYSYDGSGNLTSATDGLGAISQYNYDSRGRMVQYIPPAGMPTTYTYDWHGLRQSKNGPAGLVNFLNDRANHTGFEQVVRESNGVGATLRSFVYGRQRLAGFEAGNSKYFHTDRILGSTRLLTDSTGTITDTYQYSAYGSVLSQSGSSSNSYLFAGEQLDSESGFYYLRARYYNPNPGRFITRDPADGNLENSLSQHKYLYTLANPVNFTDPSGRMTLAEIQVVIGNILQKHHATIQRVIKAKEKVQDLVPDIMQILGAGFSLNAVLELQDTPGHAIPFFNPWPVTVAAGWRLAATAGGMFYRRGDYFIGDQYCKPGDYACTFRNQRTGPVKMAISRRFFKNPPLPKRSVGIYGGFTDASMMGIMVHEWTHAITGTIDDAYLCRPATNLGSLTNMTFRNIGGNIGELKTFFSTSLNNADNYRCWVESSALGLESGILKSFVDP